MLPPHKINYRANLWALRKLGVTSVIAICTSGGLADRFGPGTIVCPDQIIDYTYGREHTLSDGLSEEPVVHVDFTIPFTGTLRQSLLNAALSAKVVVYDGVVMPASTGRDWRLPPKFVRLRAMDAIWWARP